MTDKDFIQGEAPPIFCKACLNIQLVNEFYCGGCYGHVHSKFEERVNETLSLKKEINNLKRKIRQKDDVIAKLRQNTLFPEEFK